MKFRRPDFVRRFFKLNSSKADSSVLGTGFQSHQSQTLTDSWSYLLFTSTMKNQEHLLEHFFPPVTCFERIVWHHAIPSSMGGAQNNFRFGWCSALGPSRSEATVQRCAWSWTYFRAMAELPHFDLASCIISGVGDVDSSFCIEAYQRKSKLRNQTMEKAGTSDFHGLGPGACLKLRKALPFNMHIEMITSNENFFHARCAN